MFKIGKYYTAKPEFAKLSGAPGKDGEAHARKMSGKCVSATPRLVTLEFAFGSGKIRESFRPSEVL